jgi:hypothetical protein
VQYDIPHEINKELKLEMLYFLGIGGLVKISANSAFLEKST